MQQGHIFIIHRSPTGGNAKEMEYGRHAVILDRITGLSGFTGFLDSIRKMRFDSHDHREQAVEHGLEIMLRTKSHALFYSLRLALLLSPSIPSPLILISHPFMKICLKTALNFTFPPKSAPYPQIEKSDTLSPQSKFEGL